MCLRLVWSFVLLSFLAAPAGLLAGGANLVTNPGMEAAGPGALPEGWEPLIMGTPARFTLDGGVHHAGSRAIRIDAGEVTRSYLRSAPVPVAPTEPIEISAWVRTRDVPPEKGTVILIAEFARGNGKGEVAKVAVAGPGTDWQHLAGRVTVPDTADTLRVRMGFSYSQGTCWWDDVEVRAVEPLVVRPALRDNRLYPADGGIPVMILNRTGMTSSVRVTARLDARSAAEPVQLNGQPIQDARVRTSIARGKHTLSLELTSASAGQPPRAWKSKPIHVLVPPPMVMLPPVPTHWAREDGEASIEAAIEMALDSPEAAGQPLKIQLVDERGIPVAESSESLTSVGPSGLLSVRLKAPRLPEGHYRLTASLPAHAGPSQESEQPWEVIPRRLAHVRIDADGFPNRNGKPLFPLGMFNNEAKLKEEVEAGFNIAHFYNAARVRPGERNDDQRLADAMNRCAASGVNVLLLVPMEYAIAGEWDAFTRRIRMFRNHPALLAWDEEEGLARGDMNMETLRRVRQILQKEDPNHPFMVGDARNVIGRIKDRRNMFPADQMDLGMWWWYPLPLKPQRGDALQGEQATGTDLLLEPPPFLVPGEKPLWVGVQAYKKPGAGSRYPTPTEYRAQAYLGIIAGAKGLMWYGGSVTGGAFLAPEEAHWAELKKLVRELRDLEPLLLGRRETPPARIPDSPPIAAAIRSLTEGRILMAVNTGPRSCEITFQFPRMPAGEVRVLGENRAVRAGGGLTDRFEPYSTHVYELQPLPGQTR
jgi:hypothetical protein